MTEEELTKAMLEEAIKIIMYEWGYSRETTIKWLNKKVEGDED